MNSVFEKQMHPSTTNPLPPVSFLLAAYNEERYIADAVFSCLNQSYANIEVVVTDDGSTDGTATVLEAIRNRKSQLKFFSFPENRGKVAAFNHCFRKSTGTFIALLGADDLAPADRITRSLPPLLNGAAEMICGDCVKFTGNRRLTASVMHAEHGIKSDRLFDFNTLLRRPKVFGGTIMLTRALGENVFPLNEALHHEDWWLPLAAAARRPIQYLHHPFCYYRIHAHNEKETNLSSVDFDGWRVKSQIRKVIHYRKVMTGFQLTPAQRDYVEKKKTIHELMLAPNAAARLRRGWAAAALLFSRGLSLRDRLKYLSAWLFPRLAFRVSRFFFMRNLLKNRQ